MKIFMIACLFAVSANAEVLMPRMIDDHETVINNQLSLQLYSYTVTPYEKFLQEKNAGIDMVESLVDFRMGKAEIFFALFLLWDSHGVDFRSNRIWRSRASMIRKTFKTIPTDKFTKYVYLVGADQMNLYFTNYDKKKFKNDVKRFMSFLNEP